MKICFATYQSVMLLKGGPRTQILQTKLCLEKLGVEVSLFNSWQEFSKEDFDYVHIFGANIGTYHFAREIHKIGIPLIVTPIFFTRRSQSIVNFIVKSDFLIKRYVRGTWTDYGIVSEICSWAKWVLPNTEKEAQLIIKGFCINRDKIRVVPNGVEKRFYDSDPSIFIKQYGIENFILNVGHIGPERKNVLNLIKALENIEQPAVIIGRVENNNYSRMCLQLAKKNPRLLIIDNIPNDSELLMSAYAACDTFVLPSQFETPGIAALEAALAGAKIVITKFGGTEEYFGTYADYVEPNSIQSIQDAIRNSISREKDNTLREYVKKEYLWENIAEKLLEVYKFESNPRFS